MNNFLKTLKVFVTSLAVLACISLDAQDKKRVGVVDFSNTTQVSDVAFGRGMTDLLVNELLQSHNIEVIERGRLNLLLEEAKLDMLGVSAGGPQVGNIKGLDYLVTGTISEATATRIGIDLIGTTQIKVKINLKVINAESGEIMYTGSADGTKSGAIKFSDFDFHSTNSYMPAMRVAIERAVPHLLRVIGGGVEAKVALVTSKEVTINVGINNSRVRVGQKYQIFREGDVITDPDTGEILDVVMIPIADVTITRVETNTSVAKIDKKMKGHEIMRGDIARLAARR